MQTSQFFAISAMDVEHIDVYTPGMVVNFKCSEGTVALAKILCPSERGAEYRSITYEWSGSMVTHDCAPIARMSPPTPTPCHTFLNCQLVGEKAPYREEGAVEVGHFSTPPSTPSCG